MYAHRRLSCISIRYNSLEADVIAVPAAFIHPMLVTAWTWSNEQITNPRLNHLLLP